MDRRALLTTSILAAGAIMTDTPEAEAQAAPGQLLPGTTAFTVTGIRHRAGHWGENPVETDRPVAFTMFITCQPTFDHCRLLRLSRVDAPLN